MTVPVASDDTLDLIFREARTQNAWKPEPISEDLVRQVYELAKWGPTSANSAPARFVIVMSDRAKDRLKPHILPSNAAKMLAAPAIVIIAQHLEFYEKLSVLFPNGADKMMGYYANDEQLRLDTAFRNASMQGAYFMIAARALGLDCGPISGFSNAGVDQEFFPDGRVKSNFLCAIGHGDPAGVWPRNPRLPFEDACQIL